MNEFVRFYNVCGGVFDPKDMGDLKEHMYRRKRLYEMLGIPSFAFRNINILDVGGGSGYNTLVLLLLGAYVDLVEPNEQACLEAKKVFERYGVDSTQYKIHNVMLESFKSNSNYHIVLAEGFLHSLYKRNRDEVITLLKKYMNEGSYLVVTTMCEFSYFYEDLRRVLGLTLVRDIQGLKNKGEVLADAFSWHLNNLNYAVRPSYDWAVDTILNPGGDVRLFSIGECVQSFLNGYEVCGVSPDLFPNTSWYKDMQYSHIKNIYESFDRKKHLLIDKDFDGGDRDIFKNNSLLQDFLLFREIIRNLRLNFREDTLLEGVEILRKIKCENDDLGEFFISSVEEVIALLCDYEHISIERIQNMPNFSKAWGRGLQYVCIKNNR